MEQFNRIELQGVVGNVRLTTVNDSKMARINLATNYGYRNREGSPVIETTWHSVTAFENKYIHDLERIAKGTKLYVQGRLRLQKYTGVDGVERVSVDVQANKITIIDIEEPLQCEFC